MVDRRDILIGFAARADAQPVPPDRFGGAFIGADMAFGAAGSISV
ncbi:hypothetical protein [Bosea sp. (in: a-proteobacteria)]